MSRFHEEIQEAARWIKNASSVVVFTGAGMSTESGIPDFRSPGGLWTKTDPAQVASVEAMHHQYELFHEFYTMRLQSLASGQPHQGHRILAAWEQSGWVKTVATQNVDGFHQLAGSQRVIELHGALSQVRCIHQSHPGTPDEFIQKKPCRTCGDRLRPGVVLFGEALPADAWLEAFSETQQSDILLVIGTSLQVSPVNQLPMLATGKKILINRDAVSDAYRFDAVFQGNAGDILQQINSALDGVNP